jgi:hypothetical protein
MRRMFIGLLLIAVVITTLVSFAQGARDQSSPHAKITVSLPDNIPSETVTIRYLLIGTDGTGASGSVKPEAGVRSYTIEAVMGGIPARQAKLVMYAPGCQSKSLKLDLQGSVVEQLFECDQLPTKIVHGFISPGQIPHGLVPGENTLDIVAELEANWICNFFLRQESSAFTGSSGSCLVPSIGLGTVGVLDPANNGNFEITIPDFGLDPSYADSSAVSGHDFGIIELSLRDHLTQRPLRGIMPIGSTASGLKVEPDYPDPVMFTAVR